jgi:hypothetical protein
MIKNESKNPQFILYHELISILGHKKVDKAKILNYIVFTLKCQIKTLTKQQNDVIPFLG